MTGATGPTWRDASPALRALGRWVTLVQVVGYTTGLLYVRHTTGMTPPGVSEQYRGSDSTAVTRGGDEVPQVVRRDAQHHAYAPARHGWSSSSLSGAALALCERPSERWRRLLIVEPFVALLVSFSAMWLMRYVDPAFSWLLTLSSGLMALTFYVQSFFVLRELAGLREPA